MEHYASKEATLSALESLGFIQLPQNGNDRLFLDSPKSDEFGPVVQASIYQCRNGYWCVSLDCGSFMAPCIWNGPKADWDKSDTLTDFVGWLNKEHPGWR